MVVCVCLCEYMYPQFTNLACCGIWFHFITHFLLSVCCLVLCVQCVHIAQYTIKSYHRIKFRFNFDETQIHSPQGLREWKSISRHCVVFSDDVTELFQSRLPKVITVREHYCDDFVCTWQRISYIVLYIIRLFFF